MTDIRTTTTDYVHPTDPNLLNLHKAMQFDDAGRPVLRTLINTSTVQITGPVNILSTVTVSSTPENPVHTHITEVGTSGIIDVPFMPVGGTVTATQGTVPWVVTGTVSLNSTTVYQGNDPWTVYGTVEVNNFPTTSTVYQGTNPWVVTGTVLVGNFPTTSTVYQGTNPWNITGSVLVSNFTSTVYQGTNPWNITGTVAVSNPTNNVTATISGAVTIGSLPDASISAFEEPLAVTITPVIQQDAVYGRLDPDLWKLTEVNSGTSSVTTTGMWKLDITTATNSYARLVTTRYLRYQPGQGAMFRWTAAFTCATTGTTATGLTSIPQVSGPIGQEDGYGFGFSGDINNATFGIQHRRAGKVEIRTVTIVTPPGGAQTATIVLNGMTWTAPITANASGNYTVSQIQDYLTTATNISNYWNIDACSAQLVFAALTPGAKNGAYSFTCAGAGTICTGTIIQTVAGATPDDTWTYIGNWNGASISGFDPSQLNVYGIDMRWLGAGIVRFFIENPATGKMTLVHTQRWASTHLYPHIVKPSLRIAYRIGSTSGAAASQPASIYGASVFAGIQGQINQTSISQGYYNIDSTTRNKDIVYHLITIQNPWIQEGVLNRSQLVIQDMTVAAQANDPSVIYIVKNARGTSDHLVFNTVPSQAGSMVFAQYSVSAVTEDLTRDTVANVQTLGINSSARFDLLPFNFIIAPGETFSVFISSSNAINRTSVGVTWKVD